jgi:hypothetical protein
MTERLDGFSNDFLDSGPVAYSDPGPALDALLQKPPAAPLPELEAGREPDETDLQIDQALGRISRYIGPRRFL